jgi:hypothetical protein
MLRLHPKPAGGYTQNLLRFYPKPAEVSFPGCLCSIPPDAVAAGTAVVAAAAQDGGEMAFCTVTVAASAKRMVLTMQPTHNDSFTLGLAGSGTVRIDRGERSAVETQTLVASSLVTRNRSEA